MTTAAPSAVLATIHPVFTDAERVALAGFLAGYSGLTREAYALDLRQFTNWCRTRSLALFAVRRADIESFARELEAMGRARATVTRRLSTIPGFYRYAVEEELLERSPAAHVRRPRVDYVSHAVALDRNELGALLVAAGLGSPSVHALISLLALNGLRVSEATGADVEHLGLERGHRTLTVTRKGGKVVTVPLAPRTARAIDLAIGERTEGPVFLAADGRRLDRHGAGRIVRATARRAGIGKPVTPHTLRHAFITAAQVSGIASDASFGSSREHARPAPQRAALRRPRPAGAPCGHGDLGLRRPPGSDATMMRLMPLRRVHHRCACWHRDASGSSQLHRVHHRWSRPAVPGRHRSCEGRAGPPRYRPRHAPDLAASRSRCTPCIPRPETDVPRSRQLARPPRGTPTRRHAADATGTRRSRRPVEAPDLTLRHSRGDPCP
jgi:site-specific recombinase XerD